MDRKQSPIGSYPSHWNLVALDSVAHLKHGYQFRTHDFTKEGIKVFKITQIKSNGAIDISSCDYIDISRLASFKKFIICKGDILMALSGATIGKIARFNSDETVLQNYRVGNFLPLDDKILSKDYFYFFLTTEYTYQQIIANQTQSAQENVGKEDIHKMFLFLPPLPEQTAIAEVLSSLDDKIDLLHRQNKTLEQLAETLFRQWFVEQAEEGWEETTLEKHTEVFRGLSYKGSGLCDVGIGLPMHNLNSVYEGGGYKFEGIKFYKGEYRERHLIDVNDIIVTNTEQGHEFRLIGFPAIVPDYYGEKGLFSQHIYKLAPLKNTFLTREFIYYLLMTPSIREQIISATNGSTVNMLAIDGLQRPTFKLPPKEMVKLFTDNVKNYWHKKNSNYKQIKTLTKLRDTLLPKLMSGAVKVKY